MWGDRPSEKKENDARQNKTKCTALGVGKKGADPALVPVHGETEVLEAGPAPFQPPLYQSTARLKYMGWPALYAQVRNLKNVVRVNLANTSARHVSTHVVRKLA